MGRRRDSDVLSQAAYDAITNGVCERLAEKPGAGGRSLLGQTLDAMSTADRRLVEESLDRHAARQRAAGEAGW